MESLNKLYINAPIASERAAKRASDAFAKEKGYSYKEEEMDCFYHQSLEKVLDDNFNRCLFLL